MNGQRPALPSQHRPGGPAQPTKDPPLATASGRAAALRRWLGLRGFTSFLVLAPALLPAADSGSPLPPAQARASFQLEPGLRAELVAAEPLTASPCALTWDERGRLFVAENRGYPTGGPNGQPMGVIALLEDADADGDMDRRTVFADGLTFPNGLLPWRGGLIVTCAPDVLWLADTNGDGRADVRRVMLTGFATNGSTQLRVSHPTLGPDGWVWLTCGLSGGQITSPEHRDRSALKTTTDVRFHPDTLEVEAVDGRGQFGQSFDDFGRRFICMNRVQVQHVVLSSRFLQRNPHLAFTETVQNCPELVPNPWLQGGGGAARLYPISANLTTADSHAGTFTAACGLHIYRGDALPGRYRGLAFSCDPTGNLVHWDELVPTGASFAARRSTDPVEFLASTDNWFRPVFLATGPEGALYIADMYRRTIEHPDYLPVEIRRQTDFDSGREMGRIWRVLGTSEGISHKFKMDERLPALDRASNEQLCRALNDMNGWRRDTAFRLLAERRDPALVPVLRRIAADFRTYLPHARALALRLLAIQEALDADTWLAGLKNGVEGLRGTTLELAPRTAASPALLSQALPFLRQPTGAGLQALQVTAPLPYAHKREALLALLRSLKDLDRWWRAALLASMHGEATSFLQDLFRESDRGWLAGPAPWGDILFDLGRMAAAEGAAEETRSLASALADFARQCIEAEAAGERLMETSRRTGSVVGHLPGPRPAIEFELPVLHGMIEFLEVRPGPGRTLSHLTSGSNSWNALVGRTNLVILAGTVVTNVSRGPGQTGTNIPGHDAVLRRSRRALSNAQPEAVHIAALSLLAAGGQAGDRDACLRLFTPSQSPAVLRAAARSVVQLSGSNAVPALLAPDRWRAWSPALRETAMAAVAGQAGQIPHLLTAIESGTLPRTAVDPARRAQWLKHKDAAIRGRAEALFQQPAAGDRMKAYEQSKAALALKARATNGQAVFRRSCAPCHRLDREGVAVGPDLFGIRNQPKETILLHLIVPEHEIAPNFTGYTLETRDGRTLSGLITGETPAAVTLRQAMGIEETVPRAGIASLDAMQLSLMPQELEKSMTLQELADLLAYLKGEM